MRALSSLVLTVLVCSSLLAAGSVGANPAPDDPPEVDCDGETKTGVNDFYGRVDYAITYNRTAQRVCAVAKNTGDKVESFRYTVFVDGEQVSSTGLMDLEPGEVFRGNQTITAGIDATRDNHTVEVSSINGSFRFTFTQEVDTMNEGGVPTPHIENLTVKRNGTKSGQPRLVLDVENEGIRIYGPRAEVRTLESDSRRLSVVHDGRPGGRQGTRLNAGVDDIIVGTVRLYGDTYYEGAKFDRVSFVSYPNGTYKIWEPEFGEIPTDREIEDREVYYENESAREKYRGPDVDPISERASKIGAVSVVALIVAGLWYRRR